jgi:hypothetical protein
LVSVRDADEVPPALSGGADIIDVKDPGAGSLGRPAAGTVAAVAQALSRVDGQPPLSIALGELTEWSRSCGLSVPDGVRWLKLGLAGCANDASWMSRWLEVRRRIEAEAGRCLGWIAVAYADHIAAEAPSPDVVLDAAIATQCAGVLLDTFHKRGGGLRDHLTADWLADWLSRARARGLHTAVAGSLTIADLEWLSPLRPDIVAVRSAVCAAGERNGALDAAAVRRFHGALTGTPAVSQS